jgi:L-seryl-tRNA(Ser) seleniumtransferase
MDAPNPRRLPSVDQVLKSAPGLAALERFGHKALVDAVRNELAEVRAEGRASQDADAIAIAALSRLEAMDRPSMRPVFNLSGTVLHTNLGRAIIAEAAIEAAVAAMRNAVALEFDVDGGKRGERDEHVRHLLCELTGAEDATVVNNNAAAVLLVLNTLAGGRDAVVSRGELIEIGGAFRMPDIMARAGAHLVEVGTTNRTHRKDYAAVIGDQTGLVLKVHTSNYRIEGFTASVEPRALVELAHAHAVPVVHDLGAGTLVDLAKFGLEHEPTVAEAIAEGADLVTFSGDKLLGGPQAGFVAGRRDLIAQINKNPMKRALRIDKIRLAALEATLKLYRDPDRLAERLPTLRLLSRREEEIRAQAARLAPQLGNILGADFLVEVTACESQIGSGALPLEGIASAGLACRPRDNSGRALAALSGALRRLPIPVIGHIADGRLVFDLRCLQDEEAFLRNLQSLRLGSDEVV